MLFGPHGQYKRVGNKFYEFIFRYSHFQRKSLILKLWDEYPETIFPEIPEEPIYFPEGNLLDLRRSGRYQEMFADLQIDEIGK